MSPGKELMCWWPLSHSSGLGIDSCGTRCLHSGNSQLAFWISEDSDGGFLTVLSRRPTANQGALPSAGTTELHRASMSSCVTVSESAFDLGSLWHGATDSVQWLGASLCSRTPECTHGYYTLYFLSSSDQIRSTRVETQWSNLEENLRG